MYLQQLQAGEGAEEQRNQETGSKSHSISTQQESVRRRAQGKLVDMRGIYWGFDASPTREREERLGETEGMGANTGNASRGWPNLS